MTTTKDTQRTASPFVLNILRSARGPHAVLHCLRTHRSASGGATLWRFLLATNHGAEYAACLTDVTLQLAPALARRMVVRADGVHGVRFVNRGHSADSHAEMVVTAARDAVVYLCGGSINGSRPDDAEPLALATVTL